MFTDDFIPELPNTAHSRDGPATAWLTSEWPVTLYLFQKHLHSYEHEYIVSGNKITSIRVTFCVFFYNLFLLKVVDTPVRSIVYKKLHSPASFTIMYLKRT